MAKKQQILRSHEKSRSQNAFFEFENGKNDSPIKYFVFEARSILIIVLCNFRGIACLPSVCVYFTITN